MTTRLPATYLMELLPNTLRIHAMLKDSPLRAAFDRIIGVLPYDFVEQFVGDERNSSLYLSEVFRCVQIIDLQIQQDYLPGNLWEVGYMLRHCANLMRLVKMVRDDDATHEDETRLMWTDAFMEGLLPPPSFVLSRRSDGKTVAWSEQFIMAMERTIHQPLSSYVLDIHQPGIAKQLQTMCPHWVANADTVCLQIWGPPGKDWPQLLDFISAHFMGANLTRDNAVILCREIGCNALVPGRAYSDAFWRVYDVELTDHTRMNELRMCPNVITDKEA